MSHIQSIFIYLQSYEKNNSMFIESLVTFIWALIKENLLDMHMVKRYIHLPILHTEFYLE